MKCNVVFSLLKRFKFEKIKKNEFRPTMAKIGSLLAEALFLVFADGRKETSAMGRKWL